MLHVLDKGKLISKIKIELLKKNQKDTRRQRKEKDEKIPGSSGS